VPPFVPPPGTLIPRLPKVPPPMPPNRRPGGPAGGNLPPGSAPPPPANPLAAAVKPGGFRVPSGNLDTHEDAFTARLNGYQYYLGATFLMQVDFEPTHPAVPELEYQQFVSGSFAMRKRGDVALKPEPHPLPGRKTLTPGVPMRDGARGIYYGDRRRGSPGGLDDHYYDQSRKEDRTHGTLYRGSDYPGVGFDDSYDLIEIDLEFDGRIVHTPTDTTVMSQGWSVKDLYYVP
jgi:hypothetical protein